MFLCDYFRSGQTENEQAVFTNKWLSKSGYYTVIISGFPVHSNHQTMTFILWLSHHDNYSMTKLSDHYSVVIKPWSSHSDHNRVGIKHWLLYCGHHIVTIQLPSHSGHYAMAITQWPSNHGHHYDHHLVVIMVSVTQWSLLRGYLTLTITQKPSHHDHYSHHLWSHIVNITH